MDNNDNGYTPNKNLELTEQSEIARLRKVVAEKNELIAKFKRYDEERKSHYRRFEQNYSMMEERFNELLDAVNECDDLEQGTKEFYGKVVMRLYKGKVCADKGKSVLQMSLALLLQLGECFDCLEALSSGVGNVQKRAELLSEIGKAKARYGNIVAAFKRNMEKLK